MVLVKNLESLKTKIVILLSVLVIIITVSMTFLFIRNINKLVDSNIKLFSTTLIENEKKELKNKIDLAFNVIEMYYKQTKPKYIEDTVKRTLVAHQEQLFSQINGFYEANKDKYSESELKEHLKFLIKHARYGASGYFWINDMNYTMIMHPIKPQYDMKKFIDDPKVPFVSLGVKTLMETSKNEAFIKYRFYNPSTQKYEFKVSLVKVFKPFDWVIGTGKYLSDITPIIKKRALNDIKALRYGKSGYFWINDIHSRMIMHPIRPEYDGKIFIDTPDVPFVELGVKALENSKEGSAIIKYVFYNPATKKYEKKLSVVKLFKPWNWIIGTGVYLNAIDHSITQVKNIKDKEESIFIYKILFFAIFVIVSTILIASYLILKFIIEPVADLNDKKEHFEEIAHIDYLTGILNKRAFFNRVEESLEYIKTKNIPIAVMMLDVDHFKKVNDTYGHEAGDEVLRQISALIENFIRKDDIFGRLGGEEFALCMFDITEEAAFEVAQKIRKNIQNAHVLYEDKTIKFTMSIGVYIPNFENEDFKESLAKADKALYMAKQSGRNKVILYGRTDFDA